MSRAKPVLVMSQFNGSARLKMAQLGWLSHFEPSRGITSISALYEGHREIRRRKAKQGEQSNRDQDKDTRKLGDSQPHTPHDSAGHEEGVDEEGHARCRKSSRSIELTTRARGTKNAQTQDP